jgi:hypothetical protein
MGRIQRSMKRVANTGQRGFGFTSPVSTEVSVPVPIGDDRFKDDDASSIFFGDQRLNEYLVGAGMHWVVALRKAIERLDYGLLTASYSEQGRRAFHPRTVLGLIIYGLFSRCTALRELERLTSMDLGAMWMCGGHRIDHTTIARFVLRHEGVLSKEFFLSVAAWAVHELQLRAGVSSIDGTVIESAASHWSAIKAEAAQMRAAEARQAALAEPQNEEMKAVAEAAQRVADVANERRARREAKGTSCQTLAVVPTDVDAVIQPRKDGAQRPSYKPCTLMHEAGLIIGQHVEPSSETAAVNPLLDQHAEIFGQQPPTLLVDAGFNSGPLLGELAERGIDVLCPSGKAMGRDDWNKKGNKGLFAKHLFRFDDERDGYQCPAGQWLSFSNRGKDSAGRQFRRYRTKACGQCPIRKLCTTSSAGRSIRRYHGDEYKEAMALVLTQPRARAAYRRRMLIAEPVHAELRERLGLRRFHRCGLGRVRAEFGLYCIAFNIKKVLSKTTVLLFLVVYRHPHAAQKQICMIWGVGVWDSVGGV